MQQFTKDKRFYPYVVSFLLPVISMLLIFIGQGIYPFGSNTFLRTDMYHQYAPFFSEFRHKLWGFFEGSSLLYTWDIGLGMNFWALYAYYLASPLNWFVFLVPKGLVIEFMSYMIITKIGLCGVSMCWFLRHRYPLKREEDVLPAIIFSVFYAMSGYIAAYSWNIMWLDCIVLFPLIILGVIQIIRGENPFLYTICLGLSVLSNYYISIMICIFLVIYFFCLNVIEPWPEHRSRLFVFLDRGIRFFLYSLLGGMLAAATLLPEIYAMQGTASVNTKFPSTASQYFTIIEMFARQMPFVQTEQGLDHWPNIYSGTIVFLLLPLYFLKDRISLKKKVVNALLLLFFFLSFSMNMLNFIWHGMHYPNSLPCRQSFIYIFLLLVMCYEIYLHRDECTPLEINLSLGFAIGFLLIAQQMVKEDAISFGVYYLTIALVLLYYLLMMGEKRLQDGLYRWMDQRLLSLCILGLVFLETTANMAWTSVTITSRTAFVQDNAAVRRLVSKIQKEDPDFYRFEKMTRKTKDDGAWMNFPSVSLFSSTAYKECSDFFKLIGCEASTNAYSITGSTPLVNMLFGVRYDLYSEQPDAPEKRGLTEIDREEDTFLYRTKYALPLAFMVEDRQLNDWYMDIGTPALVQNSFADAMDADPIMINTLGTFRDGDYVLHTGQDGEYYVYINNPSIKEVSIDYGFHSKTFKNVDRGFFLELGYLTAGQEVTVHSETKGQKMDCDIYRFNYEALDQIYDKLKQGGMTVDSFNDTTVKGTIRTKEDGVMLTSIPYDKGWTVYVDGKKTEFEKIKKCFLGVRLSAGEHTIEMHYMPQGLLPGAIITGISILILLLNILLLRRRPMRPLGTFLEDADATFWDDAWENTDALEDADLLEDDDLMVEDLESETFPDTNASNFRNRETMPAEKTVSEKRNIAEFDEDGDFTDDYIEEMIDALERSFDREELR